MASPLHFLWLQAPQAFSEILDSCFPAYFEDHRLVAFLVLMPLWVFTSAISTGLTFASTQQWHRNRRVSSKEAYSVVARKLFPLLASYALAGLTIALGFLSFLVPGFYYMAIYLFVPLVVIDSPTILPWSVYLLRSKKIAKSSLRRTLLLTFALLVIGLVLSLSDGVLKGLAAQLFQEKAARQVFFLTATLFISLVTGATINVGVAEFFLGLTAEREPERENASATQ